MGEVDGYEHDGPQGACGVGCQLLGGGGDVCCTAGVTGMGGRMAGNTGPRCLVRPAGKRNKKSG